MHVCRGVTVTGRHGGGGDDEGDNTLAEEWNDFMIIIDDVALILVFVVVCAPSVGFSIWCSWCLLKATFKADAESELERRRRPKARFGPLEEHTRPAGSGRFHPDGTWRPMSRTPSSQSLDKEAEAQERDRAATITALIHDTQFEKSFAVMV